MKRKLIAKLKGIILTFVTGIASVQMIASLAFAGCDKWNIEWLPIQIGMFVFGLTWDVMFLMANFPTFERGDHIEGCEHR